MPLWRFRRQVLPTSLENCRKRLMQKCLKRRSYLACKYPHGKNMARYCTLIE